MQPLCSLWDATPFGHHVLATYPFLGKRRILLSLLAPSLINKLISISAKIKNFFTCGKEISNLAVYSSKNYYSSLSAANLSIYQNIFKNYNLKIAFSKNTFSKLLSQKIAPSKNLSSKFFCSLSLKNFLYISKELAKPENKKVLFAFFLFIKR